MKPINPHIGASPLRSSRPSYLDVQDKSWDSVLFQQSKSILDFDLNTMQRIMRESVGQLARTLFTSGFITNSTFTLSGTNGILSDSKVNFFGTVARIADPTTANRSITINFAEFANTSITSAVFTWLELWFQEVAPSGATESYDPSYSISSPTSELKLNTVYKYGASSGAAGLNIETLSNELKDPTFNAETTRRIQVRWRIRQTPGVNASSSGSPPVPIYGKGFDLTASPYTSNPLVFAQGGRVTCKFTGYISGTTLTISTVTSGSYLLSGMRITGNGVLANTNITSSGTGGIGSYTIDQNHSTSVGSSGSPITLYGWFTPSKTFTRADRSTFSAFNAENDSTLWVAGDGTASDAVALNTVDGRVYGLPIGFYYNSGTPTLTTALDYISGTTSSVSLTTASSVVAGNTSTVPITMSGGAIGGSISTGGSLSSANLTLASGASGAILANNPLRAPNGTVSSPSFSFVLFPTSGLYYDSNTSTLNVSVGGTNAASFTSSSGGTNTLAKPLTVSGLISGTGFAATGGTAWSSNISSGRYLGSISGQNPSTAAAGVTYTIGDFVIDTAGYVRIYNGSSWILGGINVAAPNTWSDLNTFTRSTPSASHSVVNSYIENISIGATAVTLSASTAWSQTISSQKIDTMTVQASGSGTTLSNAVLLEINGVPSKAGTLANLTLTNSYGIKINTSNTSATNAYGLWAAAPSGGTTNYAGYFEGATYINGTLTTSNSITSTSVSTTNISASTMTLSGAISVGTTAAGGVAPRAFIPALAFSIPSSGGASSSDGGNGQYQLNFGSGTNLAYIYMPIPPNYNGGNITARIYGSSGTFSVSVNTTASAFGSSSYGTASNVVASTSAPTKMNIATSATAGNPISIKVDCSSGVLYGMLIVFGDS